MKKKGGIMKNSYCTAHVYFVFIFFLMVYAAPESFSSDINDIVYPPPEPEKNTPNVPDNADNSYTTDSDESGKARKKSGITEEIHDRDKINRIYIDRRGNVRVPGTTSFEPVKEKKRKNSHSYDDSGYYQNENYHNHHHRQSAC